MSDEEEYEGAVIYVLPTEPNKPPHAVIGRDTGGTVAGILVAWSRDMGMWVNAGDSMPLPTELGDEITQHAKNLGVEW